MKQQNGNHHRTWRQSVKMRPQINSGRDVEHHRRPDKIQCEDAIKESIHNVSRAQPVANFETIAAGVFKKHGVVTGFVVHRAFDVAGANLRREFRESC